MGKGMIGLHLLHGRCDSLGKSIGTFDMKNFGNANRDSGGCLVTHHQERNGTIVQLLSGRDGGLRAGRRDGIVEGIRHNQR